MLTNEFYILYLLFKHCLASKFWLVPYFSGFTNIERRSIQNVTILPSGGKYNIDMLI